MNQDVTTNLPLLFPPDVGEVDLLKNVAVTINVHHNDLQTSPPNNGYIIAPYSLVLCLLSKVPLCRWICSCLPPCICIVVICLALFFSRNYIKYCLLWLDTQEEWIVCFVFVILYTAVSFPFMWGYILLNVACGYHFGLVLGALASAMAAGFGLTIAQIVMNNFCFDVITSKLINTNILRSTLSLLKGGHAFKVVVVSRLTPIPFGLQNAVFAVSQVQLWTYVVASALGLIPTQIISVYLGTTLRSIEDVLTDDNTATTGYMVLFAQIFLSIVLLSCIVKQAKLELRKSMNSDLSQVCIKESGINNGSLNILGSSEKSNWSYNYMTTNARQI